MTDIMVCRYTFIDLVVCIYIYVCLLKWGLKLTHQTGGTSLQVVDDDRDIYNLYIYIYIFIAFYDIYTH